MLVVKAEATSATTECASALITAAAELFLVGYNGRPLEPTERRCGGQSGVPLWRDPGAPLTDSRG